MSGNLHKSAEGNVRTNARREAGLPVRGWRMEHRPKSAFRKARSVAKPRLDAMPELIEMSEATSMCGLCVDSHSGRCIGLCF